MKESNAEHRFARSNPNRGREAASTRRNPFIDAIRGVSILTVISLHYCAFLPSGFSWIPMEPFTRLARNGYYGVTLFFTISGFLITSRTLQRYGALQAIKPGQFYLARFARIYPLLLALVTLFILLSYLRIEYFVPPPGVNVWAAAWKALTFQFNFSYVAGASLFAPWAPLWSLAIEEVFYVVFPIACLALRSDATRVAALVALIAQGFLTRYQPVDLYFFSTCADAIATGCLAALVVARLPRSELLGMLLMGGGFALMAARYISAPITDTLAFGPTIISLGGACFLVGASLVKAKGWRYLAPIELLGRRSYEIYLIHLPLLAIASTSLGAVVSLSPDITYLAFLATAGVTGEFIGRTFTDPLYRRITGAGRQEPAVLKQAYAA
jgi:peptidoglycan/LPS O-acetylase OafA/YrhL